MRERQHGAERIGVRAHMAGQAHLVRCVQEGQRPGLLAGQVSHGGEYPAP